MSSLVFMPKRPVADDQNARNEPHVRQSHGNQGVYWNALVFFSARILSHCGFILSLLAIWLAWLMPTAILAQPAAPDIKTLKSQTKSPRRPVSLSSNGHRNIVPIILPTNAVDNQPAHHVYFSDATVVKQTAVTVTSSETTVILQSSIPSQGTEASPQLSVKLSENATGASESLDSLVLDSDSSSRPSSLKRSSALTKFFRSYSLDMPVNQNSITSEEPATPFGITTFLLKGQRASMPTAKPAKRFPFRRCSVPLGQDSRTSKPIPRTMPYGPPFFATPPVLLNDHYSTSLKSRAQFREQMLHSRAPDSDFDLSRGRSIRRVDLSSTADKLPKPRSTSETFTDLSL